MVHMNEQDATPDEPVETADPAAPADGAAEQADAAASEPEYVEPEPVETRTTVQVGLARAVRYGPIMIATGALFAIVAAIVAFVLPVQESETYTYTAGQAAGFVAVLGGAIGIAVGALLALLLNLSAKRKRGTAMAVLTDVR